MTLLDADLAAALGPDAETWDLDRGPHTPAVRVARVDGVPVAAVLTSGRPATAARKIARTWGDAAHVEALVAEIVAEAQARGDAAVKWESPDPELAARLGFAPLRAPHPSADGTAGVTGAVRWLRDLPHAEPTYYGQTRTYTCGAVTSMLVLEARGDGGFRSDGRDADRELDFWRSASNYPACEPVGLAVALRGALPDAAGTRPVEVHLDTDGPALLEQYPDGYEHAFRAELQADSLRRALAGDIDVHRARLDVDEIAARLAAGDHALLLIDTEPMYGFSAPHWVLAHAAADGVVLLADPWISSTWGETWVDAHELPVTLADLDRMVAWSPDGYRGVVLIRPASRVE